MAAVLRSRTVSVSIESPPRQVYGFLSNPENLPKWARGLCRSVRKADGGWVVETPGGPMRFRFVGQNEFGVLDHYVSPTPGLEIFNPMRVVPNGSGSEVIFTVFQLANMSDQQYAEDVELVERDLRTLKSILEG